MASAASLAPLSPGSSPHAFPARVAAFHFNQLLSAFQLEIHHAINRASINHLNFFNQYIKKIVEKGDTPAGKALAEDPAVEGKAI
ncbi:hypothetical protein AN959_07070 [Psychrobacillus sp. FJAT-21963]|nr:hypothetical protein AN959_07070 [Psychrobacillus sp. FJAT-21963]